MATHCMIPLLGKMIRATELDNCGAVFPGAQYVATDGFNSITLSAEVEDGAEIIVRKANGSLCVNEKLADSFKRFTVEMTLCGVNPSLLAIMTNAEEYLDGADVIGFTIPEGEINKRFSLELWTGLVGAACSPDGDEASGYVLLPQVNAGILENVEVTGEDEIDFTMTGAYTRGGNQWGVGVYDVYQTGATAVNEVQTVTITGAPTGGTFTLEFGGQTSDPIPYNATAIQVQNALRALATIGPTGVTVGGGALPGTGVTVTFTGPLAGRNVDTLVAVSSLTGGTTPAVNVAVTIPGVAPAGPLPEAIDAYDHLLMIETHIAPPPSACDPTAVPTP